MNKRIDSIELSTERSAASEEIIFQEFYDAIMEHRLPPGTKLTELSVVSIYGTARHTVRKVLGRLAVEGLVELEPNRGAFVASPTAEDADDMFEMRRLLEREVLAKVFCKCGVSQRYSLRSLVQREKEAYDSGDRGLWIRLSAQFHLDLAALSGNALMLETLRKLVSKTTLLIAHVEAPGRNACSFNEHGSVLDALDNGNLVLAQEQMEQHLSHCEARVQPVTPVDFDLRAALRKT